MELVTVRFDEESLRVFRRLVHAGHAEAQRRNDRALCLEGFILAQKLRQISADGRVVLRRSEYRTVADLLRLGKADSLPAPGVRSPADDAVIRRVESRIAAALVRSPARPAAPDPRPRT